MGPRERPVCGLGAAFPGQSFQKQMSCVNPCALPFFGGVQGCLVEHLGDQEISSRLGFLQKLVLTEVIILPSIKEITVLTSRVAGIAWRVCVLQKCWTILLVKQESILCLTLWPLPSVLDAIQELAEVSQGIAFSDSSFWVGFCSGLSIKESGGTVGHQSLPACL